MITEMLCEAIERVKTMLDSECIVGNPILNNDYITVIPISKMTLGFAGAGGEIEAKNIKNDNNLPIGGVGGGANIEPIGFLVINEDKVKFLNIEGGADKWERYIENILDLFSK